MRCCGAQSVTNFLTWFPPSKWRLLVPHACHAPINLRCFVSSANAEAGPVRLLDRHERANTGGE